MKNLQQEVFGFGLRKKTTKVIEDWIIYMIEIRKKIDNRLEKESNYFAFEISWLKITIDKLD